MAIRLFSRVRAAAFCSLACICISCAGPDLAIPRKPALDGEWIRTGSNPDYGALMPEPGGRQPEVVDHGFVHTKAGIWQLWACVRNVNVGRILYKWESPSIDEPYWTEAGIAMRVDRSYGESVGVEETIQAPFFFFENGIYYLFYGGGLSPATPGNAPSPYYQICLATSKDGADYTRHKNRDGRSMLFEGPGMDRDPMVLKTNGAYYCYYSCTVENKTRGFICCRISKNLMTWSDPVIAAEGGTAGNGPWSAECPFVVYMDGFYYLFRTQTYVPAVTHVYRSPDPVYFGVNDDKYHIGTIEAAAPEILKIGDQYYISSTADYQGVMLAKLRWDIDK